MAVRAAAVLSWLAAVAAGCADRSATLSPDAMEVGRWNVEEFVVAGLSPQAFLEARGGDLVPAGDLAVTIGAVSTRILGVGGWGVRVQLAAPLAVGEYQAVLHARGVDHAAVPLLRVWAPACVADSDCDDGNSCNGVESCDSAAGCTAGSPFDCDDGNACTVDVCDEALGCVSVAGDVDGDGYGDAVCGGTDCDDTDPTRHPGAPEVCDDLDDNCDGTIDEGFTCRLDSVRGCLTPCGSTGTETCDATCTWGACVPPVEVCNGQDDDCDGRLDQGYACAAASVSACTTVCGSTGASTCAADCMPGACVPPPEECNGVDDNCDGATDEGCACTPPGSIGPCPTGCGSTGTHTCDGTGTWGSCVPPAETCDGLDEDCDGTCDNGFACCAGTIVASCTTSCASVGTRPCAGDCTVSATCVSPAEICNGLDDDCDGACDNGFGCCEGQSGACTTSCGSSGIGTCTSSCTAPTGAACSPPPEVCGNGRDDDCDGIVDEGCVPANEDCSTAMPLVLTPNTIEIVRGDTTLAANGATVGCGNRDRDVWFRIDTPGSGVLWVDSYATPYNSILGAWAGGCAGGAGTLTACGNGGCNSTEGERIAFAVAGATTLYVRLSSSGAGERGVYTLRTLFVTETPCATATALPASGTTELTDCVAPSELVPSCETSSGTDRAERVHFVALCPAQTLAFDTCSLTTTFDTTVSLFRFGCAASGAEVACNDDAAGACAPCRSSVSHTAPSGSNGGGLYFVSIDGRGNLLPSCGAGCGTVRINYTISP